MSENKKDLDPDIDLNTGNFIEKKKTIKLPEGSEQDQAEIQGPSQEEIDKIILDLKNFKEKYPNFYPQNIEEFKKMASGQKLDISVDYPGWQEKDFTRVLQELGENLSDIEKFKKEYQEELIEKENQSPAEFVEDILGKMVSWEGEPTQEELDKLIDIISSQENLKNKTLNYLNETGMDIDEDKARRWTNYLKGRIVEKERKIN